METYDDHLAKQPKMIWVCNHCGDDYDSEPPELKCLCGGRFEEKEYEAPDDEHT